MALSSMATGPVSPAAAQEQPEANAPGDIPDSQAFITYTSPDSTFAVTKELFDKAKKSILIGIYDFSAPYMRQLVLDAMARKVKVSIMLDVDSAGEQQLLDDLIAMGARGVVAPSCANKDVQVFASSHEKVIAATLSALICCASASVSPVLASTTSGPLSSEVTFL
jgi:hypothetical protein